MNGELKIIVSDSNVKVLGYLKDTSLIDRVAIVDALMNAFEMKGDKRKLACDLLSSVDIAKSKMSEDDVTNILEKLFSSLKEK